MPKITGKILKSGISEDGKRFWVKIEGSDNLIGGFGSLPEELQQAIDNETEITIPYNIAESGGKTYYNYGEKKSKPETKVTEQESVLLKAIKETMKPKIHAGCTQEAVVEKIDCGSYQKILTKTYSSNLTINADDINPQRLKALMDMVEAEVLSRITEKQKPEPTSQPKPEKEQPKPASQVKPTPKKPEKPRKEESTEEEEDDLDF